LITVFTNGCYDILHPGHIDLLNYASSLGDRLIVCLDTDERVKQNKGTDRPINSLAVRAKIVSALKPVSAVLPFDSDEELCSIFEAFNADLLVIGEEYKHKNIVGEDFVKKVIFYERDIRYSTTDVIKNINNRRVL